MKKTFDAVQWTREVRDEIYHETKNMNRKEFLAYHKKKAKLAFKRMGIKFKNSIKV